MGGTGVAIVMGAGGELGVWEGATRVAGAVGATYVRPG